MCVGGGGGICNALENMLMFRSETFSLQDDILNCKKMVCSQILINSLYHTKVHLTLADSKW